jgi:hypothetical protein
LLFHPVYVFDFDLLLCQNLKLQVHLYLLEIIIFEGISQVELVIDCKAFSKLYVVCVLIKLLRFRFLFELILS